MSKQNLLHPNECKKVKFYLDCIDCCYEGIGLQTNFYLEVREFSCITAYNKCCPTYRRRRCIFQHTNTHKVQEAPSHFQTWNNRIHFLTSRSFKCIDCFYPFNESMRSQPLTRHVCTSILIINLDAAGLQLSVCLI